MATFHVLPSRDLVGQRISEILTSFLPGLQHSPWDWPDLAESLAGWVASSSGNHVVYREDLDEEASVKEALTRDFGAALEDEIIEVHLGPGLSQFLHTRWSNETRKAA